MAKYSCPKCGKEKDTVIQVFEVVMNYDPMADRGTAPFSNRDTDNTLRLAEELGVGTRDLKQIEVIGTPIRDALFKFREVPPASAPAAGRRTT